MAMYQRRTGSYDEIPEGMKRYINNYGCHFNKKLCDFATSKMYKEVNGKKQYIQPYTKEQTEALLKQHNVQVERNTLYDPVYLINMGKADYLGSSIPNEQYLAKYVKDVLDDADAEDGYAFNGFYAKCMFNGVPIDWDEML
jgi:hypothetical protein